MCEPMNTIFLKSLTKGLRKKKIVQFLSLIGLSVLVKHSNVRFEENQTNYEIIKKKTLCKMFVKLFVDCRSYNVGCHFPKRKVSFSIEMQ